MCDIVALTKKWLRERKNEYYHRMAKVEGYRSRASYKLLQIAEKYPFIEEGNVIADLGAAPGGWMQAARKLVGEKGFVLGVDLKPIAGFGVANVASMVGDIEKLQSPDLLGKLPREADAVLADLSPNVSGFWNVDQARQIYLSEMSLRLASEVLRIGGSFLVKAFQGSLLQEFLSQVKTYFRVVKVVKPKASRMKSSELYVLALEFNGKRASQFLDNHSRRD